MLGKKYSVPRTLLLSVYNCTGGGRTRRHRREDRGAERGGVWGGVSPPHRGSGLGRGCALPQKIFGFGSQYGEFWCILDGIFYSSDTCFTRKTASFVQF